MRWDITPIKRQLASGFFFRILRRFDAQSRLTPIQKMPLHRGYFGAFTSPPILLPINYGGGKLGREGVRDEGDPDIFGLKPSREQN